MGKISSMMDMGKRSLQNSQTALQTVGHNIANKSTEGYSRQRVEIMANAPVGEGKLQIGTGARAGLVTRTNNPWLEKQIQRENTSLGFTDARSEALSRVENVYNEQINKGLNQYLTDFFNAFRELSNNPESLTSRTIVREAGVFLASDFKRVTDQLQDVQDDIDGQIKSLVDEVNMMSKEIASLNQKIQAVEVQGIPANDERDRRDLLLKKMGEKIEISWAESRDGNLSITAGNTAILVSGSTANEMMARNTDYRDRVEVFYKGTEHGTPVNITNQLKGGRIGGALEIRDKVIEDLLGNVDKMAFTLAKEVNQAHIEGLDQRGQPGVLFFEMPESEKGAARVLKLNQTIANDVSRIAAAARDSAPGDNTISNMIAAIQYRPVMDGGTATLDDFYNTQVGQVGTITQRAMKTQEAQKNIISQLTNIRESISGVSLDEETTKMVEFQKAYDASARMIRTADEMLETVLNLKRL